LSANRATEQQQLPASQKWNFPFANALRSEFQKQFVFKVARCPLAHRNTRSHVKFHQKSRLLHK